MRISIVGSGNVAWHFANMWKHHGNTIVQIMARNKDEGASLSQEFGAQYISEAKDLETDIDLLFIAVKDDAIAKVAASLPSQIFVVHSSGATPIESLSQIKRGVIWGVQSFRKGKIIDYATIPFCVEGSTEELTQFLTSLLPSPKIYRTNSTQRSKAHMALVFGNNFVSQLYAISEELLSANDLPKEILLHSILDMTESMQRSSALDIQTGPAKRGDISTIERHLHYLDEDQELKEIYILFTNRILSVYHGRKL